MRVNKNILPKISESVKIYEEVACNLSHLFTCLGMKNNPSQIFENFIYMYSHGYLSYDKRFTNEDLIFTDLEYKGYIHPDIAGMIILGGYGVCRHTSDFLYRVYTGLDYYNHRLFVYNPNYKIEVTPGPLRYLTNEEAQKLIDQALVGFDPYIKESAHIEKDIDGVKIVIDYTPSNYLINHELNALIDPKSNRLHLYDTNYHSVGEKIDLDIIKVHDGKGFTVTHYVQPNINLNSYYGTNYHKALSLLDFDTDVEKDILACAIYRAECEQYKTFYETFYEANKRNYEKVTNNLKRVLEYIELKK